MKGEMLGGLGGKKRGMEIRREKEGGSAKAERHGKARTVPSDE